MKVELKEVASGKFRVMAGADTIGSISVEPEQVPELLSHWNGPKDCLAKIQAKVSSQKNPMIAAMMRLKPKGMNRQAILRGCL